MKPKLFDRILLFLLLLFTLLLSLALIALGLRAVAAEQINGFIGSYYYGAIWQWVLLVAGAIILLISIRLMFAGKGKAKETAPVSALVQNTDLGGTYISLTAIDAMVQKHCRANNRIRNVVSAVVPLREGIVSLRLKLMLMPDTDIPNITSELQKSLKEYVEKLSGITVQDVGILVEDTSIDPKTRVS